MLPRSSKSRKGYKSEVDLRPHHKAQIQQRVLWCASHYYCGMSKPDEPNIPAALWWASAIIALQSLSFGFVFSCLNACLVTGHNNDSSDCFHGVDQTCPAGSIYNDINLSLVEAQVATSLTILGAWIGSMASSGPCERYGMRLTLLCNAVFFIAGSVMAASGNVSALFIGRLVSGLGVGVASGAPSVLLSEIASAESRGAITTLHQLGITTGILVASLLGYGMVTYVDHGWQYIQSFGCLPSVLMVVLARWVPESPKWLLSQGTIALKGDTVSSLHVASVSADNEVDGGPLSGTHGALTAIYQNPNYPRVSTMLRGLRAGGHDVDKEIADILADAKAEMVSEAEGAQVTWGEVFAYRKGMAVGIGLMFFQGMTGTDSVVFYSTTIFGLAGFKEAIIGTSCVGAVNVLTTIVASRFIDRVGRKLLLLTGSYIMLGSLLALSIVLICPVEDTAQGVVAVLAVLMFICGSSLGLGAVIWTVMAEVMPDRLRMKAFSVFLSVNWACCLLIGLLTLTAIDGLGGVKSSMDDDETATAEKNGVAYLYFVFAGLTALCLLFIHAVVPETKEVQIAAATQKGT